MRYIVEYQDPALPRALPSAPDKKISASSSLCSQPRAYTARSSQLELLATSPKASGTLPTTAKPRDRLSFRPWHHKPAITTTARQHDSRHSKVYGVRARRVHEVTRTCHDSLSPCEGRIFSPLSSLRQEASRSARAVGSRPRFPPWDK